VRIGIEGAETRQPGVHAVAAEHRHQVYAEIAGPLAQGREAGLAAEARLGAIVAVLPVVPALPAREIRERPSPLDALGDEADHVEHAGVVEEDAPRPVHAMEREREAQLARPSGHVRTIAPGDQAAAHLEEAKMVGKERLALDPASQHDRGSLELAIEVGGVLLEDALQDALPCALPDLLDGQRETLLADALVLDANAQELAPGTQKTASRGDWGTRDLPSPPTVLPGVRRCIGAASPRTRSFRNARARAPGLEMDGHLAGLPGTTRRMAAPGAPNRPPAQVSAPPSRRTRRPPDALVQGQTAHASHVTICTRAQP
jgi:hypothetical protein